MEPLSIYFTRPAMSETLQRERHDRLIHDVRTAQNRLALVSAWFTDTDIAEAFIAAPVAKCSKYAILNRSDLTRERLARAVPMLRNYFGETAEFDANCPHGNPYELDHYGGLTVLGGEDWKEGVMHHKMLLCDDVVWTGSYNLTFQARKNYETLIRFTDPSIAALFWDEVRALGGWEEMLWTNTSQFCGPEGRFRCCQCERLKRAADEWKGQGHDTNIICQECGDANQAAIRRV